MSRKGLEGYRRLSFAGGKWIKWIKTHEVATIVEKKWIMGRRSAGIEWASAPMGGDECPASAHDAGGGAGLVPGD